jgi:hypothetical protein
MDYDAELETMMRESELRRARGPLEGDDDEDDEHSEREPLRRGATASSSSSASTAAPQSRWRLRLGAVVFLGQVFMEIGRRLLRFVELNVPRYIALVDRCLVHVIRVSVHPRKRVNSLRLLLMVLVIAAIPYLIVTMYRIQLASSNAHKCVLLMLMESARSL